MAPFPGVFISSYIFKRSTETKTVSPNLRNVEEIVMEMYSRIAQRGGGWGWGGGGSGGGGGRFGGMISVGDERGD